MLSTPAPFPHVGSFAAFVDLDIPRAEDRRAELVRIARPAGDGTVLVTFPLRTGSTGTRTVELSELIDCTPLSRDEERELTDLQRLFRGREPRRNKDRPAHERAEALRQRLLYSRLMVPELAKLERMAGAGRSAAATGRTVSRGQLLETRARPEEIGRAA